jgi:hypothetical protein
MLDPAFVASISEISHQTTSELHTGASVIRDRTTYSQEFENDSDSNDVDAKKAYELMQVLEQHRATNVSDAKSNQQSKRPLDSRHSRKLIGHSSGEMVIEKDYQPETVSSPIEFVLKSG